MQAIHTRYLGPTGTRAARIAAEAAAAGKLQQRYDRGSAQETNHREAAHALAKALGWLDAGRLVGGCLPDDSWAWVLVPVPVPRAVVVVEGGIVQSVMTRTPLNVDVLDHDDFENCGSWRTGDFLHAPDCPDHDGGEVAEYVALAREADALPIDAMTSADAEVPAQPSEASPTTETA